MSKNLELAKSIRLMSKNLELAKSIRHNLFADRETVKEAWDYAFEVINCLRGSEKLATTTAMMVLLNTISNEIVKNEKEAA
tara:strand:- start:1197 stop:1439 length:243 start_codon:yes stop_codon:yes gene_type:complete